MIVEFEDKTWTLDVEEIDVRQAMVIKVKTGYNLLEWQAALEKGDVDAAKALYWLMLAQNGVNTDIDVVNFKILKFIEAVSKATAAESKDAGPDPTIVPQTDG